MFPTSATICAGRGSKPCTQQPPRSKSIMGLDPLTDLFPDQSGRAPGHDGYDHRKSEYILVSAGKRQQDGADGLEPRKEEATQDGAIDTAKTPDNCRGEADD